MKDKIKNRYFNLSEDEIWERIKRFNPQSLDIAYKLCKDRFESENKRTSAIDAKAGTLLSAVGIITAVMGLVIKTKPSVAYYGLLIAAIIMLVISAILGIISLYPRRFKEIQDEDLFTLKKEDYEEYRKYICCHLWYLFQENFIPNECKARMLQKGYFPFLCGVILIGLWAVLNVMFVN